MSFAPTTPPRDSDVHRKYRNLLAPNDNLAINVMPLNGTLLLLSDMPGAIKFDHNELTFSKAHTAPSFKDKPGLPPAMVGAFGSAHPLYSGSSLDATGDLYGIINAQRLAPIDHRQEQLRLFKVVPNTTNPWLTRYAVTDIKIPEGAFAPYMHSFALLQNEGRESVSHAVLVSHAMHIAFAKLVDGLGAAPITEGFDINKTRPMKFYVVDLESGDVSHELEYTGFGKDSLIVSHVINSYTEGGNLVVDLVGYDWLFFDRFTDVVQLNKTARDTLGHRAQTYRFEMPLDGSAGKAFELLPGRDFEFPTINEAFKGRKNCHTWGYENGHTGETEGATGFASMAVVKHDACANTTITFTRPFHYFLEPFFVPRPGGTAEDDGVVLAAAQDGSSGLGKLFVLNATDLTPLAETALPLMTTQKTHGRFMWRSALGK